MLDDAVRTFRRSTGTLGASALLVVGVLPACAPAEPPRPSDPAEVSVALDSAYARFTRAYRLGEPDSLLVLYTDEPLYLPAEGDIRRGRAELARQFDFLRGIRERGGVAHISFDSVNRGASGDLAYDVGYYTLVVEGADGDRSPPTRGKFTTVWIRGDDGAWRIHVDSFSPAPPSREAPAGA